MLKTRVQILLRRQKIIAMKTKIKKKINNVRKTLVIRKACKNVKAGMPPFKKHNEDMFV